MTEDFSAVVARVLQVPAEAVRAEPGTGPAIVWNSLRHLQLIGALEQAFGVRFTPREMRHARTIAALREIVDRQTATRTPSTGNSADGLGRQ
jgi:acyl carrier protein